MADRRFTNGRRTPTLCDVARSLDRDIPDGSGVVMPAALGQPGGTGRRPPARFPIARVLLGLVMVALIPLGIVKTRGDLQDRHAFGAAPICTAGTTGSDCRRQVTYTVTDTRIERDDHHRQTGYEIRLAGDDDWVHFDDAADAFEAATLPPVTVTAELWHGRIVAVTAHGNRELTNQSPVADAFSSMITLALVSAFGCLFLRGAARARFWRRVGFRLNRGAPLGWFRALDVTVVLVAVVGAALLQGGPAAVRFVAGRAYTLCAVSLILPGSRLAVGRRWAAA